MRNICPVALDFHMVFGYNLIVILSSLFTNTISSLPRPKAGRDYINNNNKSWKTTSFVVHV